MELILKARIAVELQRREFVSDEEKKIIDRNVSNLAARIRKLKSL